MKRKRPYSRKRFGQHFLTDTQILDKIIGSIKIADQDHILEIGPGRGDLTNRLLRLGVPVTGVEIDRDLVADLEDKYGNHDLFTLLTGDILKTDWADLIQSNADNQIVANLPYNISTPFFFKLIEHRNLFHSVTIMVQKELALRLCHPGTGKKLKDYGILSVIAAHTFNVKWIAEVSANSFRPRPKVNSAVIQLTPRPRFMEEEKVFFGFVRDAFNARRKIFLTHLRKNEPEIFNLLSDATVQALENLRPENLLPGQFLSLYQEQTL
jgi:16S rRNA (adenine1518-N6/adenine1519-N6)-dimethyltransferase